jgi:branched-chain amino acid transport system substrate-binding protein
MKRTALLIGLVIVALTFAACAPPPATPEEATPEEGVTEETAVTEEAPMEEVTLTIGFTASQTGQYNVESLRQVNALQMWIEDVNKAGGVQVGEGTMVTFDSISYDDESTKERVQELYTRLITEDNVDFLISPYSSGLTDAAAVITEQSGKVTITAGAASDTTYQSGYTSMYQIYTPASRYLTGAVDQLDQLDPDLTKIAFVYENSQFSTDVVTAARDYAESLGYETVLFEGYEPETTDFGPFISKIEAAKPEAVLGGGHFQDGSALARQLHEKGLGIKYLALLVAPPEPSFADLGDAALGVIGPSQWEPQAKYTAEAAEAAGLEWFGPTEAEFAEAYEAQFGEEPSYHAAGGYAAGLVLQKALMDAGSTNPEAVKAALDAMDIMTFYGRIKFDTSPESHGLQVGHSMVYIQWQEGPEGLEKQVVWPPEAATADALYPLP